MPPPVSTTRATMKHAAIYGGAAVASRLVGFIMLPLYAHVLRGHGYAVIGMLDVGIGFLLSLLVYGMQGVTIRLYHDEKDPVRKPWVVSTGVILIGAVTAVLSVPMIIFSKPLAGLLIDDSSLYRLVILALLSFNFEMVGSAASSWLLIRSRSIQMTVLSLLRLILGLSLNVYLILIKGMGLDGYFISVLSVNILSCVVFVAICFRECGWKYDPYTARKIQHQLLPLIPGSLASWIGRQAERVLVKGMINLNSVGILEMAYKFPILISMIVVTPFMQAWNTRRFEIADEPGAPQTISRMFTYFVFILIWFGLIMAVLIKPVLEILTPPEFHLAYRIARVEIVTLIFQGAQLHLVFGLAYVKDMALISKLRTVAAAAKVLLSWFFIANWGIYGAAFSAAVMGAVSMMMDYHYSQKRYYLPLEWRTLGICAVTASGLFLMLVHWEVSTTAAFTWVDGQVLPWLRGGLEHTFLGTWKDGKALLALTERSEAIAEILLKGPLAAAYVVVLPAIHGPTRTKWLAKVRRRAA
jgi:O-antigen/teichoic acid export membrane protein